MNGARDLLVRSAEALLESYCTRETLDRAEVGGWPEELWRAIEDSGLHEATLGEDQGGAGVSIADAMSILRVCGRYAAPVPLAEALIVGWLRSAAGLAGLAAPVALLLAGREDDSLTVEAQGHGWKLDGSVSRVPFARFAESFVCVVADGDDTFLLDVEAASCRIEEQTNLAGEARDTVHFDSVALGSGTGTTLPEGITTDLVRSRWSLTRVAMMSGTLEYLLATTVEYARERQQFGRPIGRFQAVQQQLAVLAGEVAAATSAAEAAAEAADRGSAILETAIAKARLGESAARATSIAHQVHGAIGFTHEHDLHTRTRRLWAWRDELGTEGECASLVGRHFCSIGGQSLWSELTGPLRT